MKFRLIFWLFNGVIIASILFVGLLPLVVLGADYTALFWTNNWYFIAVFGAILLTLNLYFASQWKLFQLLEKEDWSGLENYLENKIFSRSKYRSQYIRLLIHSYIIQSKSEKVFQLEKEIADKKPKLLRRHAVDFGVAHLIKHDAQDMLSYFSSFEDTKSIPGGDWVLWNKGFALSMGKEYDMARQVFAELLDRKDPIILLGAAYLRQSLSEGSDVDAEAHKAALDLQKRYPRKKMEQKLMAQGDNLQVVVLMPVFKDAIAWLYSVESNQAQ